MLKSSTASAHL